MKDAHHRGSVTVEMVILTPVFVMLTLFIVYLGRMTSTQQRLIQAADSAARAASMRFDARQESTVKELVRQELKLNHVTCNDFRFVVDRQSRNGNSFVSVGISCEVQTGDLWNLVIGSRRIDVRSTEVIDRFTFRE